MQVDWITYRAFMTANWYAGKNADDAMWNDNRKGDDMFLVDGSMRVIDLIKAYRRRTLVERALKVHGQGWWGWGRRWMQTLVCLPAPSPARCSVSG